MSKLERLVKKAQAHLEPDEDLLVGVIGAYATKILGANSTRNGIMVATDRRVVFYAKKLGGYELESFPYENISSFEQGKNLMGHNIKMFASGNEISMKWIQGGDIDRLMGEVKQRLGKRNETAPDVETKMDATEELRKYAALRDDGLITAMEFDAKKTKLLDL